MQDAPSRSVLAHACGEVRPNGASSNGLTVDKAPGSPCTSPICRSCCG
jgi:hypothetical protein